MLGNRVAELVLDFLGRELVAGAGGLGDEADVGAELTPTAAEVKDEALGELSPVSRRKAVRVRDSPYSMAS